MGAPRRSVGLGRPTSDPERRRRVAAGPRPPAGPPPNLRRHQGGPALSVQRPASMPQTPIGARAPIGGEPGKGGSRPAVRGGRTLGKSGKGGQRWRRQPRGGEGRGGQGSAGSSRCGGELGGDAGGGAPVVGKTPSVDVGGNPPPKRTRGLVPMLLREAESLPEAGAEEVGPSSVGSAGGGGTSLPIGARPDWKPAGEARWGAEGEGAAPEETEDVEGEGEQPQESGEGWGWRKRRRRGVE